MHFFVTIIYTQGNHFLKTFILTTKAEEVIVRDFKTIFFKLFFREFFLFLTNSFRTCHFEISTRLTVDVICMTFTAVPNTALRYFLVPLLHSLNLHRLNLNKPIFFSVFLSFFTLSFPLLHPSYCRSQYIFLCSHFPFIPY